MSDTGTLELGVLREAIGRETSASDIVTAQQCQALRAILDLDLPALAEGEDAPLAIHWCLAQPTAPMRAIGADGHPQRGGFLPAVALPRRMWAGGGLRLLDPLRVGDRVTRVSRIADVSVKEGRTGTLCFVTVAHRVETARGVAIEERQDIVYRGADRPAPAAPQPAPASAAPAREAQWRRTIMADPVLLFRYSAVTFNGHRIHYDRDYTTAEEGYPGLVVHGPLQATLLLNLAGALRGVPKSFEFRGTSPLIDGAAFTINATTTEAGLDLWVADHHDRVTMTASATW
jgi:3-methylfumaryl-CoA hydratase